MDSEERRREGGGVGRGKMNCIIYQFFLFLLLVQFILFCFILIFVFVLFFVGLVGNFLVLFCVVWIFHYLPLDYSMTRM